MLPRNKGVTSNQPECRGELGLVCSFSFHIAKVAVWWLWTSTKGTCFQEDMKYPLQKLICFNLSSLFFHPWLLYVMEVSLPRVQKHTQNQEMCKKAGNWSYTTSYSMHNQRKLVLTSWLEEKRPLKELNGAVCFPFWSPAPPRHAVMLTGPEFYRLDCSLWQNWICFKLLKLDTYNPK